MNLFSLITCFFYLIASVQGNEASVSRRTRIRRRIEGVERGLWSTKSPSSSTKYPSSSTKSPSSSTKSPSSSTKSPSSSTKSPSFSTKYPSSSTKYPSSSTKSPTSSTKSPSSSTKSPSSSTKPPVSSTKSPSSSTKSPFATTIPSSSTTDTSCVLEAKLAYPYADPDDAPYYGYSSKWLIVWKGAGVDYGDYCDSYYNDAYYGDSSYFCSYFNTGGSSSTYIGNVEDWYSESWAEEEDLLFDEVFTLKDVASSNLTFEVLHDFFYYDYYYQYDTWNDHMFAPILTITNKSKDVNVGPKEGWTHPVDLDMKTHIINNQVHSPNPEYKGNFFVTVTCDSYCDCVPTNYEVFDQSSDDW